MHFKKFIERINLKVIFNFCLSVGIFFTISILETSATSLTTCNPALGNLACSNAYDCYLPNASISVNEYTYQVDGKDKSSTIKLIEGERCESHQQCLSGSCTSSKCTSTGLCRDCVGLGGSATSQTSCCAGTFFSAGTCTNLPYIDTLPAVGDAVGSIEGSACEFKYSDDLLAYIKTRLDQDTKILYAYMWLFGNDESDNSSKFAKISETGTADPNKIYLNKSDYYPFFNKKAITANGAKDYDRISPSQYKGGVGDIAHTLRKNYSSGLADFLNGQTDLLGKMNLATSSFQANSYVSLDATNSISGGEAGIDYYKLLLEYYSNIQKREALLSTSLATAKSDLTNWKEKVWDKIGGMNVKRDDYIPKSCDAGNDEKIDNVWYMENCISERWKMNAPNGEKVWLVDPVFRLKGSTLQKILKNAGRFADAVEKQRNGLIYEFRSDEGVPFDTFKNTIKEDIRAQLIADATETAATSETSSGSYLKTFYKSDVSSAEQADFDDMTNWIWKFMMAWSGIYNFHDDTFYWEHKYHRGDAGFFDWNSTNEYPRYYKGSLIYSRVDEKNTTCSEGKNSHCFSTDSGSYTESGIIFNIAALEDFYLSAMTARNETINCLSNKITSLSAESGNDYRGSTGASTYTNQTATTKTIKNANATDCPSGKEDCSESQIGGSAIKLNLGTNSSSVLGSSPIESVDSKRTSFGDLSSSDQLQNAIRTTEQYNTEKTKAFGNSYTKALQAATTTRSNAATLLKFTKGDLSNPTHSNLSSNQSSAGPSLSADTLASPLPIGVIDDGQAQGERTGKNWKNGNYDYSDISTGLGQNQMTAPPPGVSEAELNSILSASNASKYNITEDDELFTIISKRYVRSGFPALFKRKTTIESVQKAIELKTPNASGSGKKDVYEPWKKFKPSSP